MSASSYTPISCSVYDFLESSAVKKTPIRLEFRVENGIVLHDVKILDLFSKEKVEFLKARDVNTNEELMLRLDAINLITDISSNKVYSLNVC